MANGSRFRFGPYELDAVRRRLTCSNEPVAVPGRQLDVLLLLVARAGQIVAKDELLDAGWNDVAVGDNSLEQAVSSLRRILVAPRDGSGYIETVPRRGYRFAVDVTLLANRESDAGLDALLAPHRAFVEGRAALETLEAGRVIGARAVFESAVESAPDHAPAHLGLANACVMQYEMTRTDPVPDREALARAALHAREACRLDPRSGEAWATMGFVLDRTGDRLDARAAANRAVALEPDNWRHHFRLSLVSWGEARLRSAHRTLALLPGFPMAHWLAATVHVARQVLTDAERELRAGLDAGVGAPSGAPFPAVALHWMLGLIHLARGHEASALAELESELASESAGQLYARECAANSWYAIGALRLRQGNRSDAREAFARALQRVTTHAMARVGMAVAGAAAVLEPPRFVSEAADIRARLAPVDAAMCRAAYSALSGANAVAPQLIQDALAGAEIGSDGWIIPIEPLLHLSANPDVWAGVLARLRSRAT